MPEDQNKICREVIQMLLIQLYMYMYLINILLKNITLDIYDSSFDFKVNIRPSKSIGSYSSRYICVQTIHNLTPKQTPKGTPGLLWVCFLKIYIC